MSYTFSSPPDSSSPFGIERVKGFSRMTSTSYTLPRNAYCQGFFGADLLADFAARAERHLTGYDDPISSRFAWLAPFPGIGHQHTFRA